MSIRVLLADDHAVVRDGLRFLLEAHGGIEVVASVGNGPDALAAAQRLKPDVLVLDINMPGLNGIDACRRICERQPGSKVLILSMHGSTEHIYRALQAGARGYLLKESAGAEVVTAVHALHTGRIYMGEKIAETAMQDYLARCPSTSPIDSLSSREREILQLIVDGRSNTETASVLSLSVKTVETYRSRMLQKLGIKSISELVKFGIEHGLVQTG